MVKAYLLFLALLAAQRLFELRVSERNAASAFRRGAVEYGRRHFRWMKLLHVAFFIACAAEVILLHRPFVPLLGFSMLAAAVLMQALRLWTMVSLGRAWNARVIVVPRQPAVDRGPYRWIRHPNYLAVAVEGIAVPLIHSAWCTALGFTALNAVLLSIRIRCEEKALARHCQYEERMGSRGRFFPRLSSVRPHGL